MSLRTGSQPCLRHFRFTIRSKPKKKENILDPPCVNLTALTLFKETVVPKKRSSVRSTISRSAAHRPDGDGYGSAFRSDRDGNNV